MYRFSHPCGCFSPADKERRLEILKYKDLQIELKRLWNRRRRGCPRAQAIPWTELGVTSYFVTKLRNILLLK